MRRLALTALGAAPLLLGGCIFAVGHGEQSDDRRLTRLEQRMAAAEAKLGAEQPKATPAAEPVKAPAEEPKK
jgi:hypothetical protein